MDIPNPEDKYHSRQDIMNDPESPEMYEVLDGEVYFPFDFRIRHATAKGELLLTLFKHVEEKYLGYVVGGPLDVIIDENQSVQPDIIFVYKERQEIVNDYIEGPPDLLIEVVAPNTGVRDRALKPRVYAKFGVKHYWIVDPDERSMIAYRLTGENYTLVATAMNDETFQSPLFPGLTIELSELWT